MLEDTHCIPNELAWWSDGCQRQALRVVDRSARPRDTGVSFFAPDFALSDPQPWLVGEEIGYPELSHLPLPVLESRKEASRADFESLVGEILRHIDEGEFQKVVPMVAEVLHFAAPLRASMFPGTFSPSGNEYGYGFEFSDEGLCGMTPELLFHVRDGILVTMALAGTGPLDGPSLLTIDKERIEHQLVVDHIGTELKTLGEVEIGETCERPYRRLKHLYTPIRARLRDQVNFEDLVACLHPTAALGGWPRRPAVKWLEQQAFHRYRRRFGAPFGYLRADGEMVCVVAIRGLQWVGRTALLAAGCGVVAQSHALSEWAELKLKLGAIERNLGLSK